MTKRRRSHLMAMSVLLISLFIFAAFASLAGGLDPTLQITSGTGVANSRFGFDVSYAGDVDGDSVSDLIIGAPGENKAYLFLGPVTTLTPASASATFTGTASSEFGYCVSNAGKINADAYDDLIIGAPGEKCAYIFFGSASISGAIASTSASVKFTNTNLRFGTCVAGIGDFDKDGGGDVIISAPNATVGSFTKCGWVGLYDNPTTGTITDPTQNFTGMDNNDLFGFSISYAGDMNYDNRSDIIIGCPGNNSGVGAAYIQNGSAFPLAHNPMKADQMNVSLYGFQSQVGGQFGYAVTNVSSINYDSYSDVAISAPYAYSNKGEVYVIYGGATLSSKFNLTTVSLLYYVPVKGDHTGDLFGFSVSWGGDTNGDGKFDLIIGAPMTYNNGSVYVINGQMMACQIIRRGVEIYSSSPGERLGISVSCGFNSSQLHYSSILVGAENGGTGKAYLYEIDKAPILDLASCTPLVGNASTMFTFSVQYSDLENNSAAFVYLHLYSDAARTQELAISPRTMTRVGSNFLMGVQFHTTTTLPNGDTYYKFETQANTGYTGSVWMTQNAGSFEVPNVDAESPGKVTDLTADTSMPNIQDGEMAINWTFPGDNNFTGTSKRVVLVYNDSAMIDEANFNLSDILKIWEFTPAPSPGGSIGGFKVEISRGMVPGKTYYFAMKAMDEQNNWGPMSNVLAAKPYKTPNLIGPPPITGVAATDVPNDDGGAVNITWTKTLVSDFSYYKIFCSEAAFTDIAGMLPLVNISTNSEYSLATKDGTGASLQNGHTYYFAVVAYDNEGLFNFTVFCSPGVKVIDDNSPIPDMIGGVAVIDTPGDSGGNLTVSWTKSTCPEFYSYNIYIDTAPITIVEYTTFEKQVVSVNNLSAVIGSNDGVSPLVAGIKYYVAVTVQSYNDKENKTINTENTAGPASPINNHDLTSPYQAKKVTAEDTPDDDGGCIDLTWKVTLSTVLDHFNVYVSTSPIETLDGLTAATTVGRNANNTLKLTGLTDGTDYYIAVTSVSWNDVENKELTLEKDGNSLGPVQPVNNHDTMAPVKVEGFTAIKQDVANAQLEWNALLPTTVPDFNAYVITYWKTSTPDDNLTEEVTDITQDILVLTGLDAVAYRVSIYCIDDAGNIGPASEVGLLMQENTKPTIIGGAPTIETNGLTVVFNIDVEDDNTAPSDLIIKWDFENDGTFDSAGQQTSHKYSKPGTYTYKVVVSDGELETEYTGTVKVEEKAEEGAFTGILAAVLIVLVVIILVLVVLVILSVMRKKRPEKAEEASAASVPTPPQTAGPQAQQPKEPVQQTPPAQPQAPAQTLAPKAEEAPKDVPPAVVAPSPVANQPPQTPTMPSTATSNTSAVPQKPTESQQKDEAVPEDEELPELDMADIEDL